MDKLREEVEGSIPLPRLPEMLHECKSHLASGTEGKESNGKLRHLAEGYEVHKVHNTLTEGYLSERGS